MCFVWLITYRRTTSLTMCLSPEDLSLMIQTHRLQESTSGQECPHMVRHCLKIIFNFVVSHCYIRLIIFILGVEATWKIKEKSMLMMTYRYTDISFKPVYRHLQIVLVICKSGINKISVISFRQIVFQVIGQTRYRLGLSQLNTSRGGREKFSRGSSIENGIHCWRSVAK